MADDTPTRRDDPHDQPTVQALARGRKVFGRFVLEAEIGRGGMAVVWRARDEELGEAVALKFLPEAVARDAVAVDELKDETRRARSLTHPNIVRIHDFVRDGASAAISMELVVGRTLAQWRLEQPGKVFSPEQLAPLAAQLCPALDYAHTVARLVHRDLKPANILVTRDGVAKVADFGIARSLSETHTRITGRAGDTAGTLCYMSPQQLTGKKAAPADDVYALGAMLYELLTGKPPFHTGDITHQILHETPPGVAERRAELGVKEGAIDPAWEETIAACLMKDASARPHSAGEVAERLGLAPAAATGAAARMLRAMATPGAETDGLPHEADGVEGQDERETRRSADGSGGLIVTTIPSGAEVTVAGFAAEKSPLTLKDMKPGTYPVVIRLPDHEVERRQIEVKGSLYATLAVTLVRATGTLQVVSVPEGLRVEVESRSPEVGNRKSEPGGQGESEPGGSVTAAAATKTVTTPATLKLPTGEYGLTFHRAGWPDQRQTVAVTSGESVSALAEFVGGTLEITSLPSGAEVFAAGRTLGKTPLSLADQVPGPCSVEFRLWGCREVTASAIVAAKQTATIAVTLDRSPVPEEDRPWTIPDLGLALEPIPAGTFVMGSPDDERGRGDNEGPRTQVTISRPFWLGRTAVTQAQWRAVMGNNPSYFVREDRPVECVSWDSAMEFCWKVTERERAAGRLPEGQVYTLPTEAQWEYACRAGTTGRYAGSGKLGNLGWYRGISGGRNDPVGIFLRLFDRWLRGWTHRVGQKEPNGWGLYDVHGNVWEWCADWHGKYPGGEVRDHAGPRAGTHRVTRGGSYCVGAHFCRSATRFKSKPEVAIRFLGFRLALTAERQKSGNGRVGRRLEGADCLRPPTAGRPVGR